MPRYLLDTNICIFIVRERPTGVLERFRALRAGDAVISVITYGELRYGAEKSRERARAIEVLDELVTLIPVEDLPLAAGVEYGEIRAVLARQGEMIGNNDLWSAAHARAANLVLVTNDEWEFQHVSKLTIENWVST